ncbi:Ig-like domain-containing protein [Aquincola sp. S2]|uniref:Ig-like domain-containing protein n=1 Tax=Pseudaquabacterium terrae TaxID=2732868 RepID=A0ABX2EP46_9BURK|nr:Ig-like domain-containing protein [Aquabacterium terrae]NRF70348.1 Ig-like domain-containing protein [Aquabacterium terrae]
MAIANWTQAQVLSQLNSGYKWSGSTITYSFPTSAGGLYSQGEAAGFRSVNASRQTVLALALTAWDELIAPTLAQGSGSTNIEFGYTSTDIGYAHAYLPTLGSVWFNVTESDLVSPVVGGYGFDTFLHEIGHALGLEHMGDYNGAGGWSPSSYQDTEVLSVMSYFGPRNASALYSPDVMQADWTDGNGNTWAPQTPMLNDIMAIQAIYGASTTTRSGSTVYGFNSNITGSLGAIYDFSRNAHPVLTIFDSGGLDTLNFSGFNSASVIDLRGGGFSSANSMTNNVAISYDTVIEDAVGGAGNDTITGNAASNQLIGGSGNDQLDGLGGDDTLIGGAGNDTLDGGDGSADTAVFDGTASSYTITVSGSTVTLNGPSGVDRATNIERFRFADVTRLLAELIPGADSAAPQLQSRSPADGATAVTIGANLVLSFNEAVRAGSGNINIHAADGTLLRSIAASDSLQLSFSGNSVIIDPAANLPASRGVYVTVAAGALADLAGNPFAGWSDAASWNFSTSSVDSSAPRIVAFSPADEGSKVALNANLVIEFDETVSVGSGNIVIQRGGQPAINIAVTDSAQVKLDGNKVTIDPTAAFANGASYTVSIDGGAFRDAPGNAFAGLGGNGAWNFSTTAPIAGDDFSMGVDSTGVLPTSGSFVSGRIDAADDGDMFKVELVAGTLYRFDMLAGSAAVDPYLVLYGPQPELQLIATDNDSGSADDAQLHFTPTTSGSYYVVASDNGGATGSYGISAGKPTDDYLASTATSGVLQTNGSFTFGVITAPTDSDMFALSLSAGANYTIDLQRVTDGLANPYLMLFDGQGKLLAFDDDSGGQGNARLSFTPATAGTYYVSAADVATGMGGYRLSAANQPVVRGSAAADVLGGSSGNDLIDGGAGIDRVVYAGARSAFTLQHDDTGWTVNDSRGLEGRDLLQGIERLQFADTRLALDLDGHAGEVARLLGVVFGPAAVHNAAYAGIGLSLLDGGMTPQALTQLALDARLGAGASHAAVVELLYTNLVGSPPPAAALSLYTGWLANGSFTPITLAQLAGVQEQNLLNIDFAGLVAGGLGYS